MNPQKEAAVEKDLVIAAVIAVEDHAVVTALATAAATETEQETGIGTVKETGLVAEIEAETGVASPACLAPNVGGGLATEAAVLATAQPGNASGGAVLEGQTLYNFL